MPDRTAGSAKIVVLLLFAAAAGYAVLGTPLGEMAFTAAGRKALAGSIDRLVLTAGPFGPVLFVLVSSLGFLVLPATPFIVSGGIIFGKYAGALWNVLGMILGASLSFAFGRYFLRAFARRLMTGRLADLDRRVQRHGFAAILYLRVLCFPFIVLNYASGATSVRFRDFFWGTALGILAPVVATSLFAGGLKETLAAYRGPGDLLRFDVVFPAALFAFSFSLPGIVARIRRSPPVPDADDA